MIRISLSSRLNVAVETNELELIKASPNFLLNPKVVAAFVHTSKASALELNLRAWLARPMLTAGSIDSIFLAVTVNSREASEVALKYVMRLIVVTETAKINNAIVKHQSA